MTYLPYIQIALSVLLVGGILIQRSDASVGAAFGGDSMGAVRYARRGFEKLLFHLTIILGILFAASTLASLVLSR